MRRALVVGCALACVAKEARASTPLEKIVVMRVQNHTIVTIDAPSFPLPEGVGKGDAKLVDRAIFDRLDQVSAPRLVELWEQDPCAPSHQPATPKEESKAAKSVEPRFESGPVAIEGGVAANKGDTTKTALRVAFDASDLRLPLKALFGGKQEVLVYFLGDNQRFEIGSNAFPLTNLDVKDETRRSFAGFYTSLFESALKNGGERTFVTEYAWSTTSLDRGADTGAPPLSAAELATLGADVAIGMREVPESLASAEPSVTIGAATPSAAAFDATLGKQRWRFRACHTKALAEDIAAAGAVTLQIAVDAQGLATSKATSTTASSALTQCAIAAANGVHFPPAAGTFTTTVTFTTAQSKPTPGEKTVKVLARSVSFVLTRLHGRYDPATLGDVVPVRVANEHVVGGRELRTPSGGIEAGTHNWSFDAFQARYAIRHAWDAKPACANPVRGVWGGPSSGEPVAPQLATDLARAPHDVKAGDFVLAGTAGLPPAGVVAVKELAPAPASASAAPVAPKKSCGCELPGRSDGTGAFALVGVAIAFARRRGRLRVCASSS